MADLVGIASGVDDNRAANRQLESLSDAVTLHGYDASPPSSEPESAGPADSDDVAR